MGNTIRNLFLLIGPCVLISFYLYIALWKTSQVTRQSTDSENHRYVICQNKQCAEKTKQRPTESPKRHFVKNTTESLNILETFAQKMAQKNKLSEKVASDNKDLTSEKYVNSLRPIFHTLKTDIEKHVANNSIIISVVDSGYVDFARNFYEGSIRPLGIKNFLPICIDVTSKEVLSREGVYCSLYDIGHNNTHTASDFGTSEYFWKTNVKTALMLEVLGYGVNVLMCDLDIVLFKVPFQHFHCSDCDIHIQMDKELYNSGFVYSRPNARSRALYKKALDFYGQYHKAHDQTYINMAIRELYNLKYPLKIEKLSWKEFPCGHYYFLADNRMFENQPPCPSCVIAHNNYLGSVAAKIYRFRENLMWLLDDGEYYSNKSAKYLAYDNPLDFVDRTREMEVVALKNALIISHLTNRTLILPTFRCCNCVSKKCGHIKHKCPLMSILKVNKFDDAFKNQYREHSFLKNAKVPDSIKTSTSKVFLINNTFYDDFSDEIKRSSEKVAFLDTSKESSHDKVLQLFKSSKESVLRLHSFYGNFNKFQDMITDFKFLKKLKNAFECSLYEQWKEIWIK